MSELKKVIKELEGTTDMRWWGYIEVRPTLVWKFYQAILSETPFRGVYIVNIMEGVSSYKCTKYCLTRSNFEHIKLILKDYLE